MVEDEELNEDEGFRLVNPLEDGDLEMVMAMRVYRTLMMQMGMMKRQAKLKRSRWL